MVPTQGLVPNNDFDAKSEIVGGLIAEGREGCIELVVVVKKERNKVKLP
jgi:hypothetical protein